MLDRVCSRGAGYLGKPLLFGPGSILDAHGKNEKIAKRDVLAPIGT